MIGSMSSAAWTAWRSGLLVMRPALWFSEISDQPRGFTIPRLELRSD